MCVQRDEDSKGGAAFGMRGFLGDRCLVCGEAVGSLSAGFGALRRAGHGAAAGALRSALRQEDGASALVPHSDNGGDFVYSVEERNTILGLQNIVRKVYVEVVERNNELAALRNYTTGAPVVAATTKSLQEGARVRTAG